MRPYTREDPETFLPGSNHSAVGSVRRVALVLEDASGTGVFTAFLALCRGLRDLGFEAGLVFARGAGSATGMVPDQIPRRLLTRFERSILPTLPALVRMFRSRHYDAVIACGYRINILASLAARLACADVLLIRWIPMHTSMEARNTPGPKGRAILPLSRWAYRQWGLNVAVSQGVADDARLVAGPHTPVQVIYNPVDGDTVRRRAAAPLEHPWFRHREMPVLVCAARYCRQKNLPMLLEVVRALLPRRPVRLVIVGGQVPGEEGVRDMLSDQASKLGIADQVDLRAFEPNPFPYMAHADVGVLSSRWEGYGNVLVEFMALGRPVVSTRCPSGPDEILAEGAYGGLADVDDVAGFTDLVVEALERPLPPAILQARAAEFSVKECAMRFASLLGQDRLTQ